MNKLLARQLRRNNIGTESLPENFKKLLDDISSSYDHQEDDRALIERSMDISSQELTETNKKLRTEAATQKVVLENLWSALMSLPEHEDINLSPGRLAAEDIVEISDFLSRQIQRRKTAEKTLELYEKAINASNNGIIITDATQKSNPMIYANPAFYQTTGFLPEDVMGKNCRFLQGDDKDQTGLIELRTALKEKRSCFVRLRNYKKDGTMFWNELRISPIFSADGEVTHYIGIQSDITQSKLTEEKLRETNARLSEFIENMPSGILIEDEHRKLVVTNTEFCKMFFIPVQPEYLIGVSCADSAEQSKALFEDPEGFIRRIIKILADNKPVKNEELKLADGRVFERDFIPIIIDNSYKGYLWNYRDITERKKIESEVAKLKQYYETTLNELPGQVAVFDTEFRYEFVNPASVKTDKVREWIIGKDDFDFCKDRGIDLSIAVERRKMLKQVIEEKKQIKFDETLERGGQTFHIERVISPIMNAAGEVKNLIAYGLDITERKRAENELLMIKAKLETSNKALSDFAYIASHDLREPLRKITAFGSLLAKTAAAKLDSDDRENLDFMIQGAKRMQQMIDDLLQYSRISSKDQSFLPVDIGLMISEITAFDLSTMIEDSGAKINIEGELGTVFAEKIHIKQLLQNLIANAIKYRRKDITPEVSIRSKREGGILCVEVEDNGIGIPANYLKQIFEMFRRLHARDEYEGSGIGLAVCKKIVELYQGEIGVRSEPSAGSVFWFKLKAEGE